MKEVRVKLGPRSYQILIAPGLHNQTGPLFLKHTLGKKVFLISNKTVFSLHGGTVCDSLRSAGFKVKQIFIPDGEAYKNLHTAENIYTYLAAQRADRDSTIVALGGGVTGDLSGFVAATFLRGINYVQLPTTLLAQVDSSIGGKTGVNHQKGKNMVGVFHQPRLVLIDTTSLSTLPRRDFHSGLYEILKYGLIYDKRFFSLLERILTSLLQQDKKHLDEVISRCCEIKAEVTSRDERETGFREILNFGHTFGHALEAVTGYNLLTHGEAVGIGMLIATELSRELELLDQKTAERIGTLILGVAPLPSIGKLNFIEILETMEHDKKRKDDLIHFVLLKHIGKTTIRKNLDSKLLTRVWNKVLLTNPSLSAG